MDAKYACSGKRPVDWTPCFPAAAERGAANMTAHLARHRLHLGVSLATRKCVNQYIACYETTMEAVETMGVMPRILM
eukprot:scaffold576206_cov25-Prasinocladus_malaysianus.AAC.1